MLHVTSRSHIWPPYSLQFPAWTWPSLHCVLFEHVAQKENPESSKQPLFHFSAELHTSKWAAYVQ